MAAGAKVVRQWIHGPGKFHLPADNEGRARALCGVESTDGHFPVSGPRAEFERVCPERICKRCRKAEKR